MSTQHQTPGVLSRGDRVSLAAFVVAGVIIVAWFTVHAVRRIVELARGTDVPVSVDFVHTTVDAPLSGGGTVPVTLDSGTLTAPDLPTIAIVSGVLEQVALIITVATVVGCLLMIAVGILRGQVFSRRNTRLVGIAGATGLIGFAATRFFANMLANTTVAHLTDNQIDNAVLTVEPLTFILAAFIIAVIGTAFAIGDRLQRETEGLV